MSTSAQIAASAKYDKTHTKTIMLKLNNNSDADIIKRLNDMDNKQGYIKSLIREDMRNAEPLSLDLISTLILPVAKKYKLKRVYLFGSYSRGEASDESDIDLLLEGADFNTMYDFIDAKQDFEHALGKHVDLVLQESIEKDNSRSGKRFKEHVERDRVLIYD